MKTKLFILLPDGIGLRNFAYGDFPIEAEKRGVELVYWNHTSFPIEEKLSLQEVALRGTKMHPLTSVYSRARKKIELRLWKKKWNDAVYDTYLFPDSHKGLKNIIKSLLVHFLTLTHSSQNGLKKIVVKISKAERQTDFYLHCLNTLKAHQPDFVFCTNQRASSALAPILAAQDLGIPTASFIFSWDNLPKATMVLDTHYYFVWSDYMKHELLQYYPSIQPNQVFVTGSPQFACHYNPELLSSREAFFQTYGLDPAKKYICFSGDDVTTSPDDPQYLEDVANAVASLNQQGENIGILFRRCPVDVSDRYENVLTRHKNLIVSVAPQWSALGKIWNQIFPLPQDAALLANTAAHCEAVINLGSSMVFDFAAHGKPCIFINYDVEKKRIPDWSTEKIYRYVHFRSMPTPESVLWVCSPGEIAECLKKALQAPQKTVQAAQDWMQVINLAPHQPASQRIWNGIEKIVK